MNGYLIGPAMAAAAMSCPALEMSRTPLPGAPTSGADGYAAVLDNGRFAGIWRDKAIADLWASKDKSGTTVVRPMNFIDAPEAGLLPAPEMAVDADAALEDLIQRVGHALIATADRRYVAIQRELHKMRSAAQVARMEAARGIGPNSAPPETA